VPGLGPKTAILLHEKLHIKSIDELAKLAKSINSPDCGDQGKTEENILKGRMLRRARSDHLWARFSQSPGSRRSATLKAPLTRIDIAGA